MSLLKINNVGDVLLNKNSRDIEEVKALYASHDREWIREALRFCFYVWGEGNIYGDMMYTIRAKRVIRDYNIKIKFEELQKSDAYKNFETFYIETVYTPAWTVYINWQKDADEYIKLLNKVPLTISNSEEKFNLMKKAKDILLLGNELRTLAGGGDKVKNSEETEIKYFEEP